ncbi:MAG: hypothetical protein WB821_13745 [Burkholderiaceae bacterium]
MKPFFCIVALITSVWAHSAFAQPNVLGLPALPQTPIDPPQASQPAASATSAPKGTKAGRPKGGASSAALPIAPLVNDADAKSVLNGGVTMATSYTSTLATLRITTNTLYQDEPQRKAALTAGRLVQRDLYMACGKQCRPVSMPAPKLLPDGKLQFDLVVDGFNRAINQDDMMNMLLGRPLAVGAASPNIAATAGANKPVIAATPAKAATQAAPPVVRDPPALPDAVQVTRSITPGSPSHTEPAK